MYYTSDLLGIFLQDNGLQICYIPGLQNIGLQIDSRKEQQKIKLTVNYQVLNI